MDKSDGAMPIDSAKISKEMNRLIAERRFDEMISLAHQLIEDHPTDYLGRWWMARTLTFKGQTEEALDWLMEAMKNSSSDAVESKIASSMANIHNVRKEWQDALNWTEIALEVNPKNVVGVIARSLALSATGKKKEAGKLLDRNVSLYVDDYQKACVASVKREKEKMLTHLRKAVENSPHSKVTVQFDPDFASYRRDPGFREIVS